VSGGYIAVDAPGYNAPGTDDVACVSDPNTPVAVNCALVTTPSVSTSGSDLTVTLPFSICAGVGTCPTLSNPGTAPYATGAIVGTVSQTPPPPGGLGGVYKLSSLCVEVDGVVLPGTNCGSAINIGGVTTSGSAPVNTTPLGGCGALVCGPGYIGTSGSQLATVFLPGATSGIPLYGTGVCLYRAQSGPPPSPDPCTQ
jgi:hypothetical protein